MKYLNGLSLRLNNSSKLLLVVAAVLGALSVILVMAIMGAVKSKTAIGFLGVILGSIIASGTSIIVARENQRNQLRMSALEKRLEVHQEGYQLWREIVSAAHNREKQNDVLPEAEQWWNENCLYLDPESRKSFRMCIASVEIHNDLLAGSGPRSSEEREQIQQNWENIMKPGRTLVRGVRLPPIEEDKKPIEVEDA